MSILYSRYFHDEASAYDFLEMRLWPEGRARCPHCGKIGGAGRLRGKSTRAGVWKCYGCRRPFTVKVGAVFEDSKVKMHLWLQAILLTAAAEKPVGSSELARILGVTIKTAWLMLRRIRKVLSRRMSVPRRRTTAITTPRRSAPVRIRIKKRETGPGIARRRSYAPAG